MEKKENRKKKEKLSFFCSSIFFMLPAAIVARFTCCLCNVWAMQQSDRVRGRRWRRCEIVRGLCVGASLLIFTWKMRVAFVIENVAYQLKVCWLLSQSAGYTRLNEKMNIIIIINYKCDCVSVCVWVLRWLGNLAVTFALASIRLTFTLFTLRFFCCCSFSSGAYSSTRRLLKHPPSGTRWLTLAAYSSICVCVCVCVTIA